MEVTKRISRAKKRTRQIISGVVAFRALRRRIDDRRTVASRYVPLRRAAERITRVDAERRGNHGLLSAKVHKSDWVIREQFSSFSVYLSKSEWLRRQYPIYVSTYSPRPQTRSGFVSSEIRSTKTLKTLTPSFSVARAHDRNFL